MKEKQLILLTDKAFLKDLTARTPAHVSIHIVTTLPDLKSAVTTQAALISFGSGVIVPSEVLNVLARPAYNFHPGPPEYRGLFPSVYALYDQAPKFGVTCHEMSNEVDSGAIIAVDRFDIPAHANRELLDGMTYSALLAMFVRLVPQLISNEYQLAHANEQWSGPIRTRADFARLCQLPPNTDAAEFQRRYRAIGEGPHHAISIELFGQRFILDNQREAPVVRGGRDVS